MHERKCRTLLSDDFVDWQLFHRYCSKNFDGPSDRMEVDAAQLMFLHLFDYGLRYASMDVIRRNVLAPFLP